MPPIRGSYGPAPLVAPNRPFAAGLSANQPSPSALAPLGHQASLEAPRGLVLGVARPVTGMAATAALPMRRQRAPIAPTAPTAPTDGVIADAGARTADVPVESRRRRAPAVTAVSVPAPRQLSRLTDRDLAQSVRPIAGTVRRAHAPGVRPSRQPETPAVVAPATPPGALPGVAAPSHTPSTPLSPMLGLGTTAQRPALGQSRRLGLGAPLGDAPLARRQPAAHRAPVAPPTSPASGAPVVRAPRSVQRAPIGEVSHAAAAPAPERARARPPSKADQPQQAGTTPAAPPRGARPAQAPVRSRSIGPASTPAARSVGLLGQRPMIARVQRAPGSAPAAPQKPRATGEQPTEVLGGPVKVHRGPEAAEASAAVGARAFTGGGEIFLPASHGPLGSPQASALLRHELTHVVQQRSFGARLPQEHTPEGQHLEAQARAAELGSQQPLVLASRDSARGGRQRGSGEAATAARQPDIQLAPDRGSQPHASAPSHETAVVQLSTVQRAERGTAERGTDEDRIVSAPDRPPKPRSEQELEELARDLYGRIRLRLSRELIVDRERAGMAIDL